MKQCAGCKYYDASADACNADEVCFADGYEEGAKDKYQEIIANYMLLSAKQAVEMREKELRRMSADMRISIIDGIIDGLEMECRAKKLDVVPKDAIISTLRRMKGEIA